jgi:alpha-L-rhamnosidase
VVIAPEPGNLEWARATYRSVRGPITSEWRQDDERFRLEVELPPNVAGSVVLPGGGTAEIGPGRHAFDVASERELVRPRPGPEL